MYHVFIIAFLGWMEFSDVMVFGEDAEAYNSVTTRLCSTINSGTPTYYGKGTFQISVYSIILYSEEVVWNTGDKELSPCLQHFTAKTIGNASYLFTSTTEEVGASMAFKIDTAFNNVTVKESTGKYIVTKCSPFKSLLREFGNGEGMNWLAKKLKLWMSSDYDKEVWDSICNGAQQYELPKELFNGALSFAFKC